MHESLRNIIMFDDAIIIPSPNPKFHKRIIYFLHSLWQGKSCPCELKMSHFDSEVTLNDQLLEYNAKSSSILPAEIDRVSTYTYI